jgi:predicted hydrolase (HD superfamily)
MEREQALALLYEYTKTDHLRRPGLSVEAVKRAAARRHSGDEETWGIVGLLHDFDYEMFPDQHPMAGKPILEERGYPPEVIYAIQCHADFTGYERRSTMDKMIFAVDELTGFIIACTLVKPTKSLSEVEPRSVRKKLKDKAFARAVLREDIYNGAEQLGVDLDEHIAFVVDALKPVASQIGLNP